MKKKIFNKKSIFKTKMDIEWNSTYHLIEIVKIIVNTISMILIFSLLLEEENLGLFLK